jgi:hypothetical protein
MLCVFNALFFPYLEGLHQVSQPSGPDYGLGFEAGSLLLVSGFAGEFCPLLLFVFCQQLSHTRSFRELKCWPAPLVKVWLQNKHFILTGFSLLTQVTNCKI